MQTYLVTNCRRKAEANNSTYQPPNPFAVAVIKDSCGHVPRTVSRTVSFSLGREHQLLWSNWSDGELCCWIWPRISCVYQFYGHLAHMKRLKNLLHYQKIKWPKSSSWFYLYYMRWPVNIFIKGWPLLQVNITHKWIQFFSGLPLLTLR